MWPAEWMGRATLHLSFEWIGALTQPWEAAGTPRWISLACPVLSDRPRVWREPAGTQSVPTSFLGLTDKLKNHTESTRCKMLQVYLSIQLVIS